MVYKELKEEPKEPKEPKRVQPDVRVVYAEYMTTLLITAMFCGTLLITTSMWVSEREMEMTFLRGASP